MTEVKTENGNHDKPQKGYLALGLRIKHGTTQIQSICADQSTAMSNKMHVAELNVVPVMV
jgi:hypothetical protein